MLERFKGTYFLGAPLAAAMAVGGVTGLPEAQVTAEWSIEQSVENIIVAEQYPLAMDTADSYLLPVESLTGISQYFHAGHPGVDMRAPMYSQVVAVDGGKVAEVSYQNLGYGNNVLLAHDEAEVTRYAHLHSIKVESGQEVVAGQVLGTVGMSGFSTGPHLHFELYQNNQAVNPILLLKQAIEQEQG